MVGFITVAGEDYLLDLISASRTPVPIYYVALIKEQPPTRIIGGDELDEPTTADYLRAPYTNAEGAWTERTQSISNQLSCYFATATNQWGTIKHWAICDSPAAGSVLWAGSFATPITVNIADRPYLPPGTLTLVTSGYLTSESL